MPISDDLLLAAHFLGLFMGGAAGLGLPVLGAVTGAAPIEHRPSIGKAAKPLRIIGQSGVGLLIVTGVIIASKDGYWSLAPLFFWLKMILVLALVAGVIMATRAGSRAMAGDAEAAGQARFIGMVNIALVIAIVIVATLVFH